MGEGIFSHPPAQGNGFRSLAPGRRSTATLALAAEPVARAKPSPADVLEVSQMPDQPPSAELVQTRRERDLYRRLLDLGEQNELEPFLREALALVVEVIGARQGYLELHDDEDQAGSQPWCIAHGFSAGEVEGIRAAISRGIIAHALATGQTSVTPSALLDSRFRERDSVRMGRIEAVVCAPIGADPPLGVLYLQGREQP